MKKRSYKISIIVNCNYSNEVNALEILDQQTLQEYEIALMNVSNTFENKKSYKILNKNFQNRFVNNLKDMLQELNGDYILFLNSTDSLSKDFLRQLYYYGDNSDIILPNILIDDNKKLYYQNYNPIFNLKDGIIKNHFEFFINIAPYYIELINIYGKLFSKELLLKCLEEYNYENSDDFNIVELAINLWHYANFAKKIGTVYFIKKAKTNETDFEVTNLTKYVEDARSFLNNITKINSINENLTKIWTKMIYIQGINRSNNYDAIAIMNKLIKIPTEDLRKLKKEYNYFSSQMTEVDYGYYRIEEIISAINSENVKCISFDVFDTLIKRIVLEPKDIFKFLDLSFNQLFENANYIYFSDIRMVAEAHARSCKNEEVTLDEIYETIKNIYCIDNEILDKMKQKELELELSFCKPRKICKKLYDLALYKNKKIICISDIYLPQSIISKMLIKCDYKISNLFLSSEIKWTKHSGKLFDYVINELDELPSQIVHIGDNWDSDYIMAKNYGIDSFHIPNILEKLSNDKAYKEIMFEDSNGFEDYFDSMNYLGNRYFFANIVNEIYDSCVFSDFNKLSNYNGSYRIFGYYPLALSLFAQAYKIYEYAKNSKIKKIHFVSRDGYMLKQAYDIIKVIFNDAPDSNYLYCSRKMMFPLSIFDRNDFYSLFFSKQNFNISPRKFYEIFRDILKDGQEEFKSKCLKYDIDFESDILYDDKEKMKFLDFIDTVYSKEKNEILHKQAKEYYKNIITENNILVDIGYSGRVENIFTKLLGYPVNSFYIHTTGDILHKREKLNGFNNVTFFQSKPKITGLLREYLYMKLDNSCAHITFNNGEAIYDFSNNYFSNIEKFVNAIYQNSALESIKEFCINFKDYWDNLDFKVYELTLFIEKFYTLLKK